MPPPVVGICAAIEHVSWGVWDGYEVTLTPRAYVTAVQRAGGLALLLAGGADLDPSSYGAEPHPETRGTWPERDRFELALARAALERDLPLLGICRGMQLLNVALGGTLIQHLPETLGSQAHRTLAGTFSEHHVRLEPGSLACSAAGMEGFVVWSHHHQGIDEVGRGLRVSGWSLEDDLPEAVELSGRRFALGVIWHPEEDEDSRLIAALVDAARATPPAVPSGPVATEGNRG